MHIEDLDYELPPRLIAQQPCPERDQSRLLMLHRHTSTLTHHVFRDLPDLLDVGDLLILNDTRVLPARLLGHRVRSGGKWEGLFLRELPDETWELLCQTRGRPEICETILVDAPERETRPLELTLVGRTEDGRWLVRPKIEGPATEILARFGHIPLPPYIRKGRSAESDCQRYQTVFADRPGAVAAPTAGLHFTPGVFDTLRQRGIGWAFVTLHVGPGTFQPVRAEDPAQHRVLAEWAELPAATVEAIAKCKQGGHRVVAVGTTSTRTLETAGRDGELCPWSGATDLTICPPFEFRIIDGLVTNFHLPRSSLLLLVGAFTGMDALKNVYREAVDREYRFYSYGDAMLIL